MKKYYIFLLFSLLLIGLSAQCPMCKMTAESNMKDGGMAGRGLNQGILYLLLLPYLAMSILMYLYWKSKREIKREDIEV